MELFSEVYSAYYSIVADILYESRDGVTAEQLEKIINDKNLHSRVFKVLPKLFSGEWNLLEEQGGKFYPKADMNNERRPMTMVEKSWLRALLNDNRILLFISDEQKRELEKKLSDVEPMFDKNDFHEFDKAKDDCLYNNEEYLNIFRTVIDGCKNKVPLIITYISKENNEITEEILPHSINYSIRDDVFWLNAFLLNIEEDKCEDCCRNRNVRIKDIKSVVVGEKIFYDTEKVENAFSENRCKEIVEIEVQDETVGLEDVLIQFSSWSKETEYDTKKGVYKYKIYYDKEDEREISIRIWAFGASIKVVSPESFVRKMRYRVEKQIMLRNL